MKNYLFFQPSERLVNISILLLRISIGILTIGHGLPKIIGGPTMWTNVGGAIGTIGIHFFPMIWGFIAACTEFFGGVALIFGFGTRIVTFFLSIMMLVAFNWHIYKGDSFNVYSFPLTVLCVFIFYFIIGGGKYSLDHYIFREKE